MDQIYLEHAPLYRKLVKAFKPPSAKTRSINEVSSPDIVVGARIRPLLEEDVAAGFPPAIFPRRTEPGVVDIHDLYNHPRGIPILKSFKYQVDKLFDSQATTEEIYDSLVAELVPFAWNGGIATLFAYGQTGSGKTFTISRLEELAVDALMDGSLDGQKQIFITIVELAGNSAYDLLSARKPVLVQDDSSRETQIVGVNEHLVQDGEEAVSLIESAASFRQTASTMKNDSSSRSHAICRIRIKDPAKESEGFLYLVDLAGSEAARDVATHGAERMREAREINISLSVLKDCIRGRVQTDALSSTGASKSKQKGPYIPYRQSALTRVLKHVFDPVGGRTCKTAVIACVNPSLADVGPSKNTLRYAELLRVLVPASSRTDTNSAASTAAGAGAKRHGTMGNTSSRDLDDSARAMPFKGRIRPGMVIRWSGLAGDQAGDSTTDTMKLTLVLCPAEAVATTLKDSTGALVNAPSRPVGASLSRTNRSLRYLCASITPGLTSGAYEVNLWQQIVVHVDMMEEEIILEYDTETRYYYISDTT